MAIFKTGAGPGGKKGKGTKPKGGYGAGMMPTEKPGIRGKQASQKAEGSKPSGPYAGNKPKGGKPSGKHGSGPSPKNQATAASKVPASYYKDRSGHPAPVPKGQAVNQNGIPNGQNNTPKTKVGW